VSLICLGLGKVIDLDYGLMDTWHFSLFSSLFNRAKRSSRRTLNPNEAKLFIIPYDLAMDGGYDPSTCNRRRRCTFGLTDALQKILSESPFFKRYSGADHLVLNSVQSTDSDSPYPRAGCADFLSKFCKNCMKTCYFKFPTSSMQYFSVPFPSSYHWWDGIKYIAWSTVHASNRLVLATYMGGVKTLLPTSNAIRRKIVAVCESQSDCKVVRMRHLEKAATDNMYSHYQKSVFCFCPPGDDPSRKAWIDIVLSGCIPVTFDPNSLLSQFPLHFAPDIIKNLGVYIPGKLFLSDMVDVMKILRSISPASVKAKQKLIESLAPSLQISMPPLAFMQDKYNWTTWNPPFRDSFDVIIDGTYAAFQRNIQNQSMYPLHEDILAASLDEMRAKYNQVLT
jgi:hypothetical protein